LGVLADKSAGSGAREEQGATMKVTVNIDCTPEEARQFMGLPNVKPMQDRIMQEIQDRMAANLRAMEPEAILRTWMPATMKGFEQIQEMFARQMGKASPPPASE
jgi:hypothetical protein